MSHSKDWYMTKGKGGMRTTTTLSKINNSPAQVVARQAAYDAARARRALTTQWTTAPLYRQSEIRTVDVPRTVSLCSTTAVFTLMNGFQQGNAPYNRSGNNQRLKSIRLTGHFTLTANGTAAPEYLRVMIVYDRQTNNAFPTIGAIIASYDNAGTATSTSYDHPNLNNSERFAILGDVRFASPNANTGAADNQGTESAVDTNNEARVDRYIKCSNKELNVKFSTTTNPAAVGDITTGGVYLITFGNIAAANAGYNFIWSSRVRCFDD